MRKFAGKKKDLTPTIPTAPLEVATTSRTRADEPIVRKSLDSATLREALAEHDPSKPPPTDRELAAYVRDYLHAENDETRLELALRQVRALKSSIVRAFVVHRGTARNFLCRGETWAVATTKWKTFCFRRYTAPHQLITIELEDAPVDPEAEKKPRARARGGSGR